MPDVWVVMSTIRLEQSLKMAELVLRTPANLAIAVHEDLDVFDQLSRVVETGINSFILELGSYAGQVQAVNEVYGHVRKLKPSRNILFVPVPDDMPPIDGWYEAFVNCFDDLEDGIGVLAGWDGHGASGFAGITAKYCDVYQKGWLHCPEYNHWWLDHELKEMSQIHGRYVRCGGATAYHEMLDYRANMSNLNWKKDGKTFNNRKKLRFSYDSIEEAPWRYWKNV